MREEERGREEERAREKERERKGGQKARESHGESQGKEVPSIRCGLYLKVPLV